MSIHTGELSTGLIQVTSVINDYTRYPRTKHAVLISDAVPMSFLLYDIDKVVYAGKMPLYLLERRLH